ncbi:MAG: protein-tyrosine-phosphatase [Crocinitomicaceae bacterium]|nr:protein-tyrosine-phosphatase [Crocinitomicaceae bacterium]
MMKILMVCLGNICRSPLAHGILEYKIKLNKLDNIEVDSAGTGSWHIGNKPDQRSIEIANKNGISIQNQRARQITAVDLIEFDVIYAMDSSNYKDIKKLDSSEKNQHKIKLILDEVNSVNNNNVPDPYYGGDNGFEHVFELLDKACNSIIKNLKDE